MRVSRFYEQALYNAHGITKTLADYAYAARNYFAGRNVRKSDAELEHFLEFGSWPEDLNVSHPPSVKTKAN